MHPDSPWYSRPYMSYKAPYAIPRIYDVVASTRTTNAEGAKVILPTSLNILAWERESIEHDGDEMVLNGVQHGFQLHYHGGTMYTDNAKVQNHHSAPHYPEAIQKYIEKEKSLGTLIGSFESHGHWRSQNVRAYLKPPRSHKTNVHTALQSL